MLDVKSMFFLPVQK